MFSRFHDFTFTQIHKVRKLKVEFAEFHDMKVLSKCPNLHGMMALTLYVIVH